MPQNLYVRYTSPCMKIELSVFTYTSLHHDGADHGRVTEVQREVAREAAEDGGCGEAERDPEEEATGAGVAE